MGDHQPPRKLSKPWFKLIKFGLNRQPWPVSWEGVAVYAVTVGGCFWLTLWLAPRLINPFADFVWVVVLALLAGCFFTVLRNVE